MDTSLWSTSNNGNGWSITSQRIVAESGYGRLQNISSEAGQSSKDDAASTTVEEQGSRENDAVAVAAS